MSNKWVIEDQLKKWGSRPDLTLMGGRIDSLAEKAGGKRKLADLVGVHENQLYRYIKAENVPSVNILVNIARAGGVSLSWLVTGEEEAPGRENACVEIGLLDPERPAVTPSRKLLVDAAWLAQNAPGTDPKLITLFPVTDAALADGGIGDWLVIDRGDTEVRKNGSYLLRLGNQGYTLLPIVKLPEGRCRTPHFDIEFEKSRPSKLVIVGRLVARIQRY